ncbi:MAG: SAF domain-containing protein [Nitriliruptoraceae bacterium]
MPRPGLRTLVEGRPFAFPAAIDRAAEWWARQPPRVRVLSLVCVAAMMLAATTVRTFAHPYGPAAAVVVARTTLEAGTTITPHDVTIVRWPRDLVPTAAVEDAESVVGTTLRGAVARGVPVTEDVLSHTGLSGLVPPGHMAVPIPSDLLTDLSPGARVDVITADANGQGMIVAHDARIVRIESDTGWVAVAAAERARTASAVATGRVVIALHATSGPPTGPR